LDKGLFAQTGKFVRRRGFIRGSEHVPEFRETYDPGDWAPVFPEGVPGGTTILFRGLAGAGKTRLAMKLAVAIGTSVEGGSAAICSLENPTDDVVRMATGVGVDPDDILISDAEWNETQLRQAANAGVRALVIDSIQKMGDRPNLYFEKLKEFTHGGQGGRVLIAISQSNARGGTRGGLSAEYDLAETVAVVTKTATPGIALITIEKNRYAPPGKFKAGLVSGAARLKRVK
jgi:hypothetical protein